MKEAWKNFIHGNSTGIKIARTVCEAVISWVLMYVADIVGLFHLSTEVNALCVSFLTVVLTAVMGVVQDTCGKEIEG